MLQESNYSMTHYFYLFFLEFRFNKRNIINKYTIIDITFNVLSINDE